MKTICAKRPITSYMHFNRYIFMHMTRRLLYALMISAAFLGGPDPGWTEDMIPANTMPSADVTVSFIQPGRIARIYVKEGELVKVNQTLIQQDAAAQQAQLSHIKEQSEDMTQIETQKANLAQKKVYLERLERAAERGSATELEVEDAKLAVKIAEFALKAASFEHEQDIRKYKEEKIRVNYMTLKSPIAGRVEKIEVEVGESINGLDNAMRIVQTDPLWIDVHVPVVQGSTLRLDQTADVYFPGAEQDAVKGKIIVISTVADAASSTLRVRIEVPNRSNRPAGEHVRVSFPKR